MPVFFDQHSLPISISGGGGVGTGIITVADTTALSAYDANSLDDGALAFVQTLRSYFSLRANPASAPTAVTIVAANSTAPKAWYRTDDVHLSWDEVSTFYIDNAGDDENDGQTALTPIRTLEELTRRTYRPSLARATTFQVRVGPNGAGGSEFVFNVNCSFVGDGTEHNPGTPITNAVALVQYDSFSTPSYTPQQITAAISGLGRRLLVVKTSDGIEKLAGFQRGPVGGPNEYYTRLFNASSAIDTPAPGDTVSELDLPLINANFSSPNNSSLSVSRCFLGFRGSARFFNITGLNVVECGVSGFVDSCPNFRFERCLLNLTLAQSTLHGELGLLSEIVASSISFLRIEGRVRVRDNCSVVESGGQQIFVYAGSYCEFSGEGMELRDTIEGIVLEGPQSSCYFNFPNRRDGQGYLYGAGNNTCVKTLRTNAQVLYVDKDMLQAAATVAQWSHPDGAGGTTSGSFAALPSAASIPTAMVGIFPAQ